MTKLYTKRNISPVLRFKRSLRSKEKEQSGGCTEKTLQLRENQPKGYVKNQEKTSQAIQLIEKSGNQKGIINNFRLTWKSIANAHLAPLKKKTQVIWQSLNDEPYN